ncbi:DUF4230 domain-containing protein [Chryseobacterium sp.]|uniref:DUF4230 domain-containing protein n=1 Tax=Chryseobacterium sp. TaxID=1871047 RepID=UPI0012A922E5|nr:MULTISPECIES: DUF4230 domain-containing protein [Chryseobacterium group]MDF0720388.1 DUF4230 domain-containing protein [Kaistella sp. PBT33-4]QFG53270.1 DUF4230 domain-containing protein [Chryseobacterium sp.]
MKNNNIIKGILIGAAAMLVLFLMFRRFSTVVEEKTRNDYYILKNQITKMNKMVVMEQDFSTMQKTKVAYEVFGRKMSENQILAFTRTNAQVSYNLNKLVMEVDSVNRKLVIKEIPPADIRITPVVEIQAMDDSFFNRIDDVQIKKVTKAAKDDAYKRVDQNRLRSEGRKQLMDNLNSIFVLAKALDYSIEDETQTLDLSDFSKL